MDQIISNLSNPGWWFTAVIIAIIASALGAYLRSGIDYFIALFSSRFRRWKEKRDEARNKVIEKIAADAISLIIAFFRTAIIVIFFSTMFVVFSVSSTGYFILDWLKANSKFPVIFLPFLSGIFSIILAYITSLRISVVLKACKLYKTKKAA